MRLKFKPDFPEYLFRNFVNLDGTPIINENYYFSYHMLFYNFKPWFNHWGRSLYRTKFGWFVTTNKWGGTVYRATGLLDALKDMYKYRKKNN